MLPWLKAVWMSQQLWWLLRGMVNCGACDVVLANRLGCSRGLGIAAAVVVCCYCCCCRHCLLASQWNTEESFPAANGNKPLIPFSECQCPGRIDGNTVLQAEWKGPAVNLCSTCTDHLQGGMALSMQRGESMQPNKTSAHLDIGWISFSGCLLKTTDLLMFISDFRTFYCPVRSTCFTNRLSLQGIPYQITFALNRLCDELEWERQGIQRTAEPSIIHWLAMSL